MYKKGVSESLPIQLPEKETGVGRGGTIAKGVYVIVNITIHKGYCITKRYSMGNKNIWTDQT